MTPQNMAAELCPTRVPAARTVRPAIATVLAALEPAPALVLNHVADVLAWTDTYAAMAGPLGILDAQSPNLIRFTFTDRRARSVYPDWDRVAIEQVANLRSVAPGDPEVDELVAELAESAGDAFTHRWEARPVERKTTGTKRIVHPEVGELTVQFETMQLADRDDQRWSSTFPQTGPPRSRSTSSRAAVPGPCTPPGAEPAPNRAHLPVSARD